MSRLSFLYQLYGVLLCISCARTICHRIDTHEKKHPVEPIPDVGRQTIVSSSDTEIEQICVVCYEDFKTEVNNLLTPCPNRGTENQHATCIECTIHFLVEESKLKTTYNCPICRKEIATPAVIEAMIKSQNKDIKTYEIIETYCREVFNKYLDEAGKHSIYSYTEANGIQFQLNNLSRLLETFHNLNVLLVDNGYVSIVQELLAYVLEKWDISKTYYTNLHEYFIFAILSGNVTLVQQMLCLHIFEVSSNTVPLHCAVWNGNMAMIKLLMFSSSVNLQDGFGNTPLHFAVYHNRIDIVMLFMTLDNIDLTIKNNCGNTPRDCAIILGYTAIAELLSNVGS